jgi:hypothetical protein
MRNGNSNAIIKVRVGLVLGLGWTIYRYNDDIFTHNYHIEGKNWSNDNYHYNG